MHYLLSHWASCVRSLKLWSLPIWPQCHWLPPRAFSQGRRTWVFSRRYPLCQPMPCADSQSSALSVMVQQMLRECNSVPRGCVSRTVLTAVSPPYAAFLEGLWSCLPADHTDLHSYSGSHPMNFIFRSHKNRPSLQAPGLAAEFTIAVWLKAEQ